MEVCEAPLTLSVCVVLTLHNPRQAAPSLYPYLRAEEFCTPQNLHIPPGELIPSGPGQPKSALSFM